MRRLLMIAFLGAAISWDKYGCEYDCHLFKDKGSARGFIEYNCTGTAAACCVTSLCQDAVSANYRGLICPTTTSEVGGADGSAQYKVGVPADTYKQYPRNYVQLDGGSFQTCPSTVYTCQGCGCTKITQGSHNLS